MKNKIVLSLIAIAAITSCQTPNPPQDQIQQVNVKPYETPRTQKEEFDKDWNQQFVSSLRDNATHKMVINAIRKSNAEDKNAMAKLCLKPNIQCFLDRISFPNEKTKISAKYTKLIHRELYKVNDKEFAIFGYEKSK